MGDEEEEEGVYGLVSEEEVKTFLEEMEKLCQEKEITEEQQVELENKLKEVIRNKPFNFAEYKRIEEELNRLRRAELPEEIPLKKSPPTEKDFKKAFGVIGAGKPATREITENKSKKTQTVKEEIVTE
ncbi:7324_t:CDS:2 [Ambispora leptoticha]|uniref:7324_t:CDS:1 n=1 Tax=Ambispora leptoticha TaxID=144679 RepID=A0A9N9ENV7_9GLOM|nr:7324_t:CDS:2 [Ambispora leptoticha]